MQDFSPEQIQHYVDTAVEKLMLYLPQLLLALLVLIIGLWIIKRIVRLFHAGLRKTEADEALALFLGNLLSILLKALLLISVASMIGIETTSFIALLGAAGLAIGLALQGSLANIAGGVLILVFRPFRVGDFIDAQGVSGTVRHIQIFSTILHTGDNKVVVVPNGKLSNDVITNFSRESTRRVDLLFGIGYNDDIALAKQVIADTIAADGRALSEPAQKIVVSELADNSVNITVRVWVEAAEYWNVRFALLENVKINFDANGISIPYPQRDVHLHPATPQ